MNFKVAIDGPAGSGKSTISKKVAKSLNFNHLDTGAMYRALTLEALRRKIIITETENYDFLDNLEIEYHNDKIFLNKEDVSKEIRSPIVTKNVSLVSANKDVREKMKILQIKMAQEGKIIMDGRDIGYNVLPDADVKIFLTASVSERAKRRLNELKDKGIETTVEEVEKEIIERDYMDSNRLIAPLRKAEDAIIIDTTNLNIEEVCKKIIGIITERMIDDGR